MASRYNVAADLTANNAGFIAGFAAAERAVHSFNRTMATAAASAATAQQAMNASSAGMASSAAVMATGADRTRQSVAGIGSAARDTRGQVVTAMNGMNAATAGFTTAMAANARSMEATGRSAQVLRQGSESAGRGMQLVGRESAAANRSLSTSAGTAAAATAALSTVGNGGQAAARGVSNTQRAVELANRDLDRFNRTARGFAMTGLVGAATAVYGAFQGFKIFAEYESSLADLNKVIDSTDAEMRDFDLTFRELNNTLPATYNEIAETAAVAGQLGIEKQHISDFAETMIRMGTSTVLSAEDSAMAIARLTNIMGSSQGDADRYGAAIVELGNNFAAQEDEIVLMGMRIAGMGKQLNMSEGDVLALSTSLTSLGIRAEMGGSAISRTMTNMNMAIEQGTETGQKFAEVMGMSIEDTATLMEEDAYGALIKFVEGLEQVEASGGNVDETLQELGITELRQMDTMRRLVGASEELTRAQELGNNAWEENTALIEESEQRYETFASQMTILGNSISDVMSNIGNAFAQSSDGIIGNISDILLNLEDLTNGFFDAEGGLTEVGEQFVSTATTIGGIVGVLGLAGAAFMAFGVGGAVTVGVVAGVGLIIATVKEFVDIFTEAPYESGMRELANIADETTRESAESYLGMKDEINEALKELAFAETAEEAAKAREKIVGEVESMVDEIVTALDSEQAQMEGLIEGYMERGTEETRKGLENVKKSYQETYDELREAAKNQGTAMNEIVANEIDESGRITQDGLLQMQGIAQGMDGMFSTAVASNVSEFRNLSEAFDFVATDSEKVQGALTEASKSAADSIAELNQARGEEVEFIKNSAGSQEEKNFLLDAAELKYADLTSAIIADVAAMEEEAQQADSSANALEGLTDKQKQLLGALEGTSDGMYSAADAYGYNEKQATSMATANTDAAVEVYELTESLHTQAEAINKNAEQLGTVPDQLNAIKEASSDVAYELGENFAKQMHDGSQQVDMGSAGTMKVEEFVAAVKNGEITVNQAGMGMLNALRSELGMGSLTPEAEQNIQTYMDGLDAGKMSVEEFATSLGLDFKEGMLVDVGPEGTMTIESFKDGVESGTMSVLELASVLMTNVEVALTKDLSQIGKGDIESLVTGMESGIVSAEEVMSVLGTKVEEGAMIELEDGGTYTMDTLVRGLESGELSVEEFLSGIKLMMEDGFDVDVSEQGAKTPQSYAQGLASGKGAVDEQTIDIRSAVERNLGETDATEGGQKGMLTYEQGIGSYLDLPKLQADAAKTGVEDALGSTTDGGGGQNSQQSMLDGILAFMFPTAAAAEMTSDEVEAAMGNTSDGGGGAKATSDMSLGISGGIGAVQSAASSTKSSVESTLGITSDNGGGSKSVNDMAGGIRGAKGNTDGASVDVRSAVERNLGQTSDGGGGSKSINDMASNISGAQGNATGSASGVKGGVEGELGATTDGGGGVSSVSIFANAIAATLSRSTNMARRASDAVTNVLGATTDGQGGQKAGSMFSSGLSGQAGSAMSAGSSVSNSGRSGLSSNSNTYGLGQNFGSGFVRGIRSYVGAAVRAAANLARSAINAVKRAQKSSSPSKIMIGLGKDNADGFIVGISGQVRDVEKTAGSLATSAISAFDSTMGRDAFSIDTAGMNSQLREMRGSINTDLSAKVSSLNQVEMAHRQQPAYINVDVGGQQFETFSENIYANNTKRLNFKDSYR